VITVKRALISVSDKSGLIPFARALASRGVEIVSTGGTAALLAQNGVPVIPVSDVSGFPEILDGRVKTLTPQIHGGILAMRDRAEHLSQIGQHGIKPIDLVVVNLYPFERTVAQADCPFVEAIENIDIGGPTMVRSAAKNFTGVAIVTDPADYELLSGELAERGGITPETSYRLARKAFAHTAAYDAAISSWLDTHAPDGVDVAPAEPFPEVLTLPLRRLEALRYGENPHQPAAIYTSSRLPAGIAQAQVLHGKQLSYNNYLDTDAVWSIVTDFDSTVVAIVKHTNPCGVALGSSAEEAYRKALETDPVSAYGGIVGCNATVTAAMAKAVSELFLEVVVAPDFESEALEILFAKKNLRILKLPLPKARAPRPEFRGISGGILAQVGDTADDLSTLGARVVTRRQPTDAETRAMSFGWKMIRHLKSNAVAFAAPDRLLSSGAGQTSRVETVRLAAAKTRLPLRGSALASDAFFPFPDGLIQSAEAGATAIIQPGGSVRDADAIAAADERGLTMVFTGRRHFKH
jgi:phosphoribosylaminoimidazolecarboxamide formyltransferase/IMP cyclohydrolase